MLMITIVIVALVIDVGENGAMACNMACKKGYVEDDSEMYGVGGSGSTIRSKFKGYKISCRTGSSACYKTLDPLLLLTLLLIPGIQRILATI